MSDQSLDVEDVPAEADESLTDAPNAATEDDAPADGVEGQEEDAAPEGGSPEPAASSIRLGDREFQTWEEAQAEWERQQKRLNDAQQYIRSGGHKTGAAPPEGFEGPDVQPLGVGIFSDSTPPRSLDDFRDAFVQDPEWATGWAQRNPGAVRQEYMDALQTFWAQQDRSSYDRYWEPIRDQQRMEQLRAEVDARYAPIVEAHVLTTSRTVESQVEGSLGPIYKQIEGSLAQAIASYPPAGAPGSLFTAEDVRDPTGQRQTAKILWLADQLLGSQYRSQMVQQAREAAKAAAEEKKAATSQDAHAKVGETRGNAGAGSDEGEEEESTAARAVRRVQGRKRLPG